MITTRTTVIIAVLAFLAGCWLHRGIADLSKPVPVALAPAASASAHIFMLTEPPCRDTMSNGDETYRFIECNHSMQTLSHEVIAERLYVRCTCKKE